MTLPSGNAGGVGYVGISKATDASMIISEAMFGWQLAMKTLLAEVRLVLWL